MWILTTNSDSDSEFPLEMPAANPESEFPNQNSSCESRIGIENLYSCAVVGLGVPLPSDWRTNSARSRFDFARSDFLTYIMCPLS